MESDHFLSIIPRKVTTFRDDIPSWKVAIRKIQIFHFLGYDIQKVESGHFLRYDLRKVTIFQVSYPNMRIKFANISAKLLQKSNKFDVVQL